MFLKNKRFNKNKRPKKHLNLYPPWFSYPGMLYTFYEIKKRRMGNYD